MTTRSLARRMVNAGLGAVARRLPLAVYWRVLPRNPVGFFYHAVSDQPLAHVRHLYPIKSSGEFEHDLRFLKAHFTPIGYPDLLAHFEGRASLPENAAFISFDDGFSVCHSVARPLLKKHGVPAVFFLATDWIDNRGMYYRSVISLIIDRLLGLGPGEGQRALDALAREVDPAIPTGGVQSAIPWLLLRTPGDRPLLDRICRQLDIDIEGYLRMQQPFLSAGQIRSLLEDGFTIGAHTRRHAKLMDLSPEEQRSEIVESCRIISELTGESQVPFAFPFSGHRVDRGMLADLRRDHPHVGLIFDTKKLDPDHPFVFNRIMVDRPVPGVPQEHNLAHWLRDAYARQVRV